MANFLIFMGEPKQAIEHAKEGIRLNPFHENWRRCGTLRLPQIAMPPRGDASLNRAKRTSGAPVYLFGRKLGHRGLAKCPS